MDCTDASKDSESQWRERQFADAQALAHVGSWEFSLLEDGAAWSDELCRIFGQPVGSTPTFEEFVALIHPEDRDRVRRDLGRIALGEVCDSSFRIIRPSGEIRHVHGRARRRPGVAGGASFVAGTIQDVTYRHEAEN